MSKKNYKNNKNNKKKSTRKNYKIESLEPRLMMDATLDGWVDDFSSVASQLSSSLNKEVQNFSSQSLDSYIETLQTKTTTTTGEDYIPSTVENVLQAASLYNAKIFDSSLNSIAVNAINADFKDALDDVIENRIVDEITNNSTSYPNLFQSSVIASLSSYQSLITSVVESAIRHKSSSTSSNYHDVVDKTNHGSLFKFNLSGNLVGESEFDDFVTAINKEIKATELLSNWKTAPSGYTVKLCNSHGGVNNGLSFGLVGTGTKATINDKSTIRADISDFSGVAVKLGLLDQDNVELSGVMKIEFEGDKSTAETLDASFSVDVKFRQLISSNTSGVVNGDEFFKTNVGYGEETEPGKANGKALGLKSAPTPIILSSGTAPTIKDLPLAYSAGVDSDGNATHYGNLEFTVNSLLFNPASLSVTSLVRYVYEGNKWVWKDSLNNPATDIELLENFRMGPVMQKLSNLAYWLHDNSTVTKENPNPLLSDTFGGLLGQNVSEIAQFSSLLNDILSCSPSTLQEFVDLPQLKNLTANAISVQFDTSSKNLTFTFVLKGPDIIGKNVSLLTNKLEELGFDVIDNQSLGLDITNRTLSFDLKVPLDGSLDFKTGDLLTDVVSKVETNNYDDLGRVIGSAYVQANGDIVRFSFNSYSISVDDLKKVTIAATPVTTTDCKEFEIKFYNGSSTILLKNSIDGNDNANSIMDKIVKEIAVKPNYNNVRNYVEIETHVDASTQKEYLLFTLKNGWLLDPTITQYYNSLSTTSSTITSTTSSKIKKITQYNSGDHYELFNTDFFSEDAVDCIYFDLDRIKSLSVKDKDEFIITFKYEFKKDATSTGDKIDKVYNFKYDSSDVDWCDSIVAFIADNEELKKERIQVKIINHEKLVFLVKDSDVFKKGNPLSNYITISVKNKTQSNNTIIDGDTRSTNCNGYLYTSDLLPIDCSSWSCWDAYDKAYIEIKLSGASPNISKNLELDKNKFENIDSLDSLVSAINECIENDPILRDEVLCETREGKITFRILDYANYWDIAVKGISGTTTPGMLTLTLLDELSNSKGFTSGTNTNQCLEITLNSTDPNTGKSVLTSYSIVLPTIDQKSRIEDVIEEIVNQCNGIMFDSSSARLIGINGFDIDSIVNLNDCTIGSVLGIVGKAVDGCVFRVSGINKTIAENDIEVKNLTLEAAYKVTGLPYINANIGPANTQFINRDSANHYNKEIPIYLNLLEQYKQNLILYNSNPSSFTTPPTEPSLPAYTLFEHATTFKMNDKVADADIIALPGLMDQCKKSFDKWIEKYITRNHFNTLYGYITDPSVYDDSSSDSILTLKNLMIDVSNAMEEFIKIIESFNNDKIKSYFDPSVLPSLNPFEQNFRNIINKINRFVNEKDVAQSGPLGQGLLSEPGITGLPNLFSNLETVHTRLKPIIDVNVDNARYVVLNNELSNAGISFEYNYYSTETKNNEGIIIDNCAGVVASGFTLTDSAAKKKEESLGSSFVTISNNTASVSDPITIPSGTLPSFSLPAVTESGLKALDALDISQVFASIVDKFGAGFISEFCDNTSQLKTDLPILGRSIGDICGAFSALREIENFFKTAQSKTLQDMIFALDKLGIKSVVCTEPDYSHSIDSNGNETGSGRIYIDISKALNIFAQKYQLDKLFESSHLCLGGSLEAYLDITASIDFKIVIEYQYEKAWDSDEFKIKSLSTSLNNISSSTPLFKAEVTLSIPSVSTDLNVSVGNLQSPKLKIVNEAGNGLNFKVSCGVDFVSSTTGTGSSTTGTGSTASTGLSLTVTSFDVEDFSGALGVEMNGIRLGTIDFIKVPNSGSSVPIIIDPNTNTFNVFPLVSSYFKNSETFEGVFDGDVVDSPDKDGCYIKLDFLDPSNFTEFDLFEKLRLVTDALSESLRKMQSGLNKQVLSKSMRDIPFIGDKIVSVADSITCLDSEFIEPFRKFVYNAKGMTAESVTEKLYLMLNKSGLLKDLLDCSSGTAESWAGINFNKFYKGIQYCVEQEDGHDKKVCWRIQLGGKYSLDPNADFDLGFPGLGLRAEGGVNIELEWTLNIGFGVDQNTGAFLLFNPGDDFTIKVNVNQDTKFKGSLGFLEMKATVNTFDFDASLGIDLNDGGSTNEISVSSLGSGISVSANFDVGAYVGLSLTLGAGDMFPSIESDFVFDWGNNGTNAPPEINYMAFEKLHLNAGEFIDKMFGGIFKKVKKVIEPIQPLIDFLQSEIPVLNKLPAGKVHITVLDLIKQFGKGKMDFGFLDDIIQLNQIMKMFSTSHTLSLLLPDLVLFDNGNASTIAKDNNYRKANEYESASLSKRANTNTSSTNFLKGIGSNIDDYINNLMDTFGFGKRESGSSTYETAYENFTNEIGKTGTYNDLSKAFKEGGLSVESRLDVKQAGPISTDPYGWQFPIIQDPISQVVGLLVGRQADLVTYHMHPLVFNFNWANSYPIVGPLCADIGFNFGVCFDLKFGYDTLGMVKWKDSGFKNFTLLLDGFYIADWDSSGKDIAEIVFHSGVVAGASVAGRAGVNVALNLDVNLNFNDPNNDGKIRLRELAGMLKKPIEMFDVSATIDIEAYAYLDYVIGRKKWVLWSSGAFELFDTASKKTRKAEMISDLGKDKVVNIGDYAYNRGVGDMTDGADVVSVTVNGNDINVDWYSDRGSGSGKGKVSEGQTLYIYAGEYGDTIKISGDAKFNIVIFAGNGDDKVDLSGLDFVDGVYSATVYGEAGNDVIRGAASCLNYLFGDYGNVAYVPNENKKRAEAYYDDEGVGNNIIYGGEEASNFIFGGFSKDTIYAGKTDVNYIFGDGGCVEIKIDDKDITVTDVRAHDLYDEGGDDDIYGGIGIDHIYGGAGKDFIDANAGNDVIYGGKGHDVIFGRAGDDEIHGGDGVDIIFGDAPYKDELLIASRNDNSINGETPIIPWQVVSEELKKDDKNAQYLRTPILKSRNAQCGSDRIYGDNGSDIIFGDNGLDDNSGKNDFIYGGAGNDFIDGDGGDDTIHGDSGEDVIYGGLGSDVLDGGADNDVVFGDNGLNGYTTTMEGEDLFSRSENEDDAKKVFGDALVFLKGNFKINNLGLQSNLFSETGDADLIYAGNDSDFVDGQGGNDTYKISFMGGFYSAYTNVMDSGKNDDNDSMSVEGTFENDNLLVRNSNYELGMIALLPDTNDSNDESTENASDNQYKYEKKKIERINYWVNNYNRGIEQISLNAGAGDDKIAVDGTLSVLSIDAGAGDDSITVGQLFESERVRDVDDSESDLQVRYENAKANVAEMDVFGTTLTSQGYLSNGVEHPTTITGGLGNDTFNVLHASAAVALMGGEGSDTFNVATFQRVDLQGNLLGVLQNAPVTLIGGVGDDKMNVVGSDGDDTFVVSGGSIQSSGVDIQAVSIENQDVFGGAGDDSFYVLDTIDGSMTHLYGNDGNDSFYNGGNQSEDAYIVVDNEDYKGHSGIIEHEVEAVNTDKYRQKKTAAISVNIRDNDVEKNSVEPVEVLFVDNQNNIIEPSAIIEEGDSAQTVYYLALSRNLKDNETITVNVYAPSLSAEDIQRGNRGFVFIDANNNEQKTLSVTFTKDDCGKKAVTIKAVGDKLVEGNDYFALLHKVVSSTTSCKPCRNAVLFFKDTSEQTQEYIISDEDDSSEGISIVLNASRPVESLKLWCDDRSIDFTTNLSGNVLTFETTNPLAAGTKIYISYRDYVEKENVGNHFVITEEHIISADDFANNNSAKRVSVSLKANCSEESLSLWCDDASIKFVYSVHNNTLTFYTTDSSMNEHPVPVGTKVYISYMDVGMYVDNGCTIQMQYDTSMIDPSYYLTYSYGVGSEISSKEDDFNNSYFDDDKVNCKYTLKSGIFDQDEDISFVDVYFYYRQKMSSKTLLCKNIITAQHILFGINPINDINQIDSPIFEASCDVLEGDCEYTYTINKDRTITIKDKNDNDITNSVKWIQYFAEQTFSRLWNNGVVNEFIQYSNDAIVLKGAEVYYNKAHREVVPQMGVGYNNRYYYKKAGTQLIICDAKSGQPVSVTGSFYFFEADQINDDGSVSSWKPGPISPKVSIPDEPDPNTVTTFDKLYDEEGLGRVVITQSGNSTDVSEGKINNQEVIDSYAISLSGPKLTGNEMVKAKINPLETPVFTNGVATDNSVVQVKILGVKLYDNTNTEVNPSEDFFEKDGDGNIVAVIFNSSNYDGYFVVTVVGNDDGYVESDSPKLIALGENTIENIKGALYEDGAGRMPDLDLHSPMIVRYRPKGSTSDEKNETSDEFAAIKETLAEKQKSIDEYASVDRVFVNNMDNVKDGAVSSLKALDDDTVDSGVKDRTPVEINDGDPLSLKIEKSNSELYHSDKFSLRMNHSDVSASGINFGNMEYAEINLGKGTDKVDVYKTVYRDDAFQTFTVINSGGNNESSIATWKASDWNKDENFVDSVNGTVKYNISLMKFENGFGQGTFADYYYRNAAAHGQGLSDVCRMFVEVKYKNGSMQRREVLIDNSSSTNITLKQDLTAVAPGVQIESVSLVSCLRDDDIVIHSYAAETVTQIATCGSLEKIEVDDLENGAVAYSVSDMLFKEGFDGNTFQNEPDPQDGSLTIYRMFLDVEFTDGSVQRREVVIPESSAMQIVLKRDFTPVPEGVSIKSASLLADPSGDGMLVVNAQGGDDKIDAIGDKDNNNVSKVTREDLVVIGGTGNDTIDVNTNAIAFGDRGMVEFVNDDNKVVTRLGSTGDIVATETDAVKLDKADYTTPTDKGYTNYFQTDGVIRDPNIIVSKSDLVGGDDIITTHGDKNVAIGGAGQDIIHLDGNNNVAIGDNGEVLYESAFTGANNNNIHHVYGDSHRTYLHYVQTTSDTMGDMDEITTGDGNNVVMGGTNSDRIATGNGNDIIIGDGGEAFVDRNREALLVSNQGRNIDTDDNGVIKEDGSAGSDVIKTSGGDNVIFGGLNTVSRNFDFVKNSETGKWETEPVAKNNKDLIESGSGRDVVFGDNAYATFKGNHERANGKENSPEVRNSATLSFNFQGAAQSGLAESASVGTADYKAPYWNNIAGSLAGTYGNDDSEIVRFDDGTRASAMSVSYAGIEWHRNTSTDDRINLQAYNLGLHGTSSDADKKFMNTGLMTTAPNAQCLNKFEVSVDGVAQYFTSYDVVVYLDIPDSHSASGSSVRKVSIYMGNSPFALASYYVNDSEGHNFNGQYIRATATSAGSATYANYVVFTVSAAAAKDKFRVIIEDAYPDAPKNGKNLPGIAGIQIKGDLHKQDVAASTNIKFGGDDVIKTSGGDDIVVGGTGSDHITTYGDERYGINDNDVVFGDNAKMLFTDRDSNDATATTLTTAESIGVTLETLSGEEKDDSGKTRTDKNKYLDHIYTGDGNDVVVGGLGADHIEAGATAAAEAKLDGIKVVSVNFTRENADASNSIVVGEAAGVVTDTNWHNMYIKNGELHDIAEYSSHTVDGVEFKISSYAANGWWNENNAGNYAMTHENSDEHDGDTANSKLYNAYFASQQQYEIKLTMDHIDQFRSKNGLATGDACDLYIYLGGDNNDTDTYNYVYSISLNNVEYRYLNDWTGHKFDGDYKEATYSHYVEAWSSAHQTLRDSAVRVQLEGNYVVFRNFRGNKADIRIKNVLTFGGQSPKNLPVISAVQIVAGAGKDTAAIGGDHDKDLVYGDDAKLWFDLDIPYAADENLANYKNRAIEAKSVAIDSDVVKMVSTDDTIITGKDRDVVVGGEGGDTIETGLGDDVALGGSANLMVEHNNPLGVFTPNTEIVLDQHTINTNLLQNYLDNDNANIWQFQNRLNQNQILGIDKNVNNTNDRKNTITDNVGRNLFEYGSTNNQALVPPEEQQSQSTNPPHEPTPGPSEGGEGQGQGTGEGQGQGSSSSTGEGQGTSSSSGSGSTEMRVETLTGSPQVLTLNAGETIKLVCTEYPQGNQWWTPNVVIYGNNAGNSTIPEIDWAWDGGIKAHTNVGNNVRIDIPDHPNGANGEYEIYLTARTSGMVILYVGQG